MVQVIETILDVREKHIEKEKKKKCGTLATVLQHQTFYVRVRSPPGFTSSIGEFGTGLLLLSFHGKKQELTLMDQSVLTLIFHLLLCY